MHREDIILMQREDNILPENCEYSGCGSRITPPETMKADAPVPLMQLCDGDHTVNTIRMYQDCKEDFLEMARLGQFRNKIDCGVWAHATSGQFDV
jgi:hypothetical protein